MALDPNIILSGTNPNFIASKAQGAQAAQATNQVTRQNAINALYREQGPGIAAGDQTALNALSRFSPEATLGIQAQHQQAAINQARLESIAQSTKIQTAKWVASQNAADLADKENEMQDVLISANSFYEAGDESGLVSFLSNHGFEPGQVTLQTFPEMAAQAAGVAAAIKEANEIRRQNEPGSSDVPASFTALKFRANAAGLTEGTPEYRQFMLAGGRGSESSSATQKIARLEAIGIPNDVAIRIADGVYRMDRDPTSRKVQVVDLSTGQIVYGSDSQADQPQTTGQPNLSFGEPYVDAPKAFGLEGAARKFSNTLLDAVGAPTPFPETQKTQSDFAVLREKLINDITNGYRRQPPSWLLKNIEALTPEAGRIFSGPAGAESQLNSIGRDLEQELQVTYRQLASESLSPATRQELQARAQALESGVARISSALKSFRPETGGNTTSTGIQWGISE